MPSAQVRAGNWILASFSCDGTGAAGQHSFAYAFLGVFSAVWMSRWYLPSFPIVANLTLAIYLGAEFTESNIQAFRHSKKNHGRSRNYERASAIPN